MRTDLKYRAFCIGANAVLNYHFKKGKGSQRTKGGGTYYYTTYTGYGKAAIIEPKNKRKE